MRNRFPYTDGIPIDRDRILIIPANKGDKPAFDMWQCMDVIVKEYDNNTYQILKNRYGDSNVLVKEQFNVFDFVN